jgi:serine/threonine protein phosphatase PrpC
MGNLLGAPVTEKETHVGVTENGAEYGVSSMQGWRVHMEDAHITETRIFAMEVVDNKYRVIDLPGHSLFAVFDGHGGTFAAAYSGRNMCRVLSRQQKFVEYAKFELERPAKEELLTSSTERSEYIQSGLALLRDALSNAFVEIDKEIYCALKGQKVPDADKPYQQFRSELLGGDNNYTKSVQSLQQQGAGGDSGLNVLEEEGDSGTTACVVLLTPEWVVCANAGDSRAVISRLGNKAVPLSYDHKPDDEAEERRIRAAGGYVAGGRVEGDLAVSRGLGDFRFKNMAVVMSTPFSGLHNSNNNSSEQQRPTMTPGDQKVSPVPEIIVQTRNASQDEFIIVACDGIWDVQTNYEAVKTVGEMFQEGESNLGMICEEVRVIWVNLARRIAGFLALNTISVNISHTLILFSNNNHLPYRQFCDVGLSMGSKDNMTALVVKLAAQTIGEGGGVLARRQLRDAENAETNREQSRSNP